jgi:ABC-type sugar transport system substrate-binding protein
MFRCHALAALMAAVVAGCGGDGDGKGDRDVRLAAVIKGVENPFFATMRDGMLATARRHGVSLHLDAAVGLQDTAGQAARLASLDGPEPACYVINPINPTNLIQALAEVPGDPPIVNIDSPVDQRAARAEGVTITTYIGTDNVAAGRVGANAMAGFVDDGARVAVIAGIPGDVGSGARASGFKDSARGRFDVVQTIAADFDRERARLAAEALLRADPEIQGFFAVNDEMALGVAAAVRAAGRRGDVAVVGMDGIRAALAAVRRGALSATVAQYPYAIGRLGVEACLASARGKSVPATVDAPVQIVTRENAAHAQANFPQPATPFDDPLAGLLQE